jgi:hypothetical protein
MDSEGLNPGRQNKASPQLNSAPWWVEEGEEDDFFQWFERRPTQQASGTWKWLIAIGFLMVAILGLGFATAEGVLPGLGMVAGVVESGRSEAGSGGELSNEDSSRQRWSVPLAGEKIAAPMDVDSRGSLSGVAVATAGDPIAIQAYTSKGVLKWVGQFPHNQGYSPLHLAPIDYDADGQFDELLVVISGSTNPPGVVNLGPEAFVFNFVMLDNHGNELWYYQCAHVTRSFLGASLSSPRCSESEAAALYQEKLRQHGYNYGGRYVDETFGRVDIGSTGGFEGAIYLPQDRVQVR